MPYTLSEIQVKVIESCRAVLGSDHKFVKFDIRLTDLYMDSIELVELLLNLEWTFGIGISDVEMEACLTLQDLIDLIKSKVELIPEPGSSLCADLPTTPEEEEAWKELEKRQ